MNVKWANDHIIKITEICEEINSFDKKNSELIVGTGFLCDYRKMLEYEIENTEPENLTDI